MEKVAFRFVLLTDKREERNADRNLPAFLLVIYYQSV